MPVTPTYPGVYVEEIPSGVRTITGVATSITAFVGRASRGPTDTPVVINSFSDYERIFGGLAVSSSMSYAVRDFYLNGGSQAIIVRIYPGLSSPPSGSPPASNRYARLTVGGLKLAAAYPGSWGNALRARVTLPAPGKDLNDFAASYGLNPADLFNLTVRDTGTGVTEQYLNLTWQSSTARSVDKVLENNSSLVRTDGAPTAIPTPSNSSPPGSDPFSDANSSKVADGDKVDPADGGTLSATDFTNAGPKKGLFALENVDLFNILCLPPYTADGNVQTPVVEAAISFCEQRRAFLIIDPPSDWTDKDKAKAGANTFTKSKNAAIFFPRLVQPNPLKGNQMENFVPCGAVAGVFARTDTTRGVWKAPAGLEATLVGVPQLSVLLNDAENGELNPLGINCLRSFPNVGRVVWGARTLRGADILADEYKYIPVRRLALYIEESLYRGTQWVVFEPNDEPLWAQIRLNVGAFMQNLFRQGAFQGQTPRDAYFVKCDKESTTQNDINLGIVNIIVGFAPLKPAEFVIIKLQQMAGQVAA